MKLRHWIALPNGTIYGIISGHPMIADGTPVTTEPVRFNEATCVAFSQCNEYELQDKWDDNLQGEWNWRDFLN